MQFLSCCFTLLGVCAPNQMHFHRESPEVLGSWGSCQLIPGPEEPVAPGESRDPLHPRPDHHPTEQTSSQTQSTAAVCGNANLLLLKLFDFILKTNKRMRKSRFKSKCNTLLLYLWLTLNILNSLKMGTFVKIYKFASLQSKHQPSI